MRDDETKAVTAATYRPGRTAFAYRVPESLRAVDDDEAGEDTPVERVAAMIRCPNAMRPSGWDMAHAGFEATLLATLGSPAPRPGHWMVHAPDGTFLGARTDAEFIAGWTPGYHDPYLHYAFDGPEITLRLAPSGGFIDEQGTVIRDVRTAMAGLVRVDSEGGPIVAADASLSLQACVLFEAEEGDCAPHVVHVMAASEALLADGDPGAWLDVSALDGVVADVGEGRAPTAPELTATLLAALDNGFPADPMWRMGAAWETVPDDWTSRDTPGSGALWRAVDEALGGVTNGDAQFVLLDEADPPAAVTDWFSGTPDGRRVGPGGAETALVDLGHSLLAVAWMPDGAGDGRGDPLATELLSGFAPDFSRELDGPRDGAEDVLESLSDLDLYPVLPEPDLYPGYARAALLKAHAEGAGIGDLLASLAEVMRTGAADEAFVDGDDDGPTDAGRRRLGHEAARAGRAGGKAHPLLVAMLAGIDEEAWVDVDVPRDVTSLLDASRAGGTLADIAAAVIDEADDGGG